MELCMSREEAVRQRMALLRANDVGAYLCAAQPARSGRLMQLLAGTDACLRSLTQRLGSLACASPGGAAAQPAPAAPTSSNGRDGAHPALDMPFACGHAMQCASSSMSHAACAGHHTCLFRGFHMGCPCLLSQALWPCRTPPQHGTGCRTACAQTSPRSRPCCRAAS